MIPDRVNVTGVVTLGDLPPKEVTKRKGQVGKVKEDCIIEDDTGYSTIHLCDDIITKSTPQNAIASRI